MAVASSAGDSELALVASGASDTEFDTAGAAPAAKERKDASLEVLQNMVAERRRHAVFVSHTYNHLYEIPAPLAVIAGRRPMFELPAPGSSVKV